MKPIDLTGQKFGRLTVIQQAPHLPKRHLHWLCHCDCGNESIVDGAKLRNGHTKSCGCLASETTTARNLTHGKSLTPEHQTWGAIKERCDNPNNKAYKKYGARGITMCQRWRTDFETFLHDMGLRPSPSHSIDRIDGTKHYSCGICDECKKNGWTANCRWATPKEQATNRSKTIWITHEGQTRTLKDWARQTGIRYATLYNRVVLSKWPIALAFTLPPDSSNRLQP